jgi:hypothetical protein
MKRKLIIGAACAALLGAPLVASAHNNDAGLALLGGIVGGLIIGSTLNSGPAVAYAAPVYAPPPPPRRVVVIKRRQVYVERQPVYVEYRHDRGRHTGWYR